MADDLVGAGSERTLLDTARFRVVEVPLHDGATKAIVRHPGSVCIVPVLDDGQICLIRNYRISVDQWLIEIPAGTMEPPEPPLECAHRELQEETGYVAAELEKLGELFLAPGLLDERAHVFCGRGLTPGPQKLEADEKIETLVADLQQIDAWIDDGKIQDAKTLAALDMWRRADSNGP